MNKRKVLVHNLHDKQDTLFIKCKATGEVRTTDGPVKLRFTGYSGGPVKLTDYGFDAPVYYNIVGIVIKQKTPIMYDHTDPIGHTLQIAKTEKSLSGHGITSFPGEKTELVKKAVANKFPFEASMGLLCQDYTCNNITYVKEKEQVVVNNRSIVGPAYVIHNTILREMTVTPFGRDSETSFEALNKEQREMIKNSTPTTPAPPPVAEPGTPPTTPPVVLVNAPPTIPQEPRHPPQSPPPGEKKPTPVPAPPPTPQTPNMPHNHSEPPTPIIAPPPQVSPATQISIPKVMRLMNAYPKHVDYIEKSLDNGYSLEAIENGIKLDIYQTNLPVPPTSSPGKQSGFVNNLTARMCLAVGMKPERLELKLGKEVVGPANDLPQISLVELLVNIANAMGGSYNGHSDIEGMCKYIKTMNLSGYSTFDMPDFMERVAQFQMDDRWALNPPFAPSNLKEESNKDFRPTQRIRPGGGEPWLPVHRDGKIDLLSMGTAQQYVSNLDTVGGLLVLTRHAVINDDMGIINDLLDMMVEGAMMVPDIKLGLKMLAQASAPATFWINNDNSFLSTALTRANLSLRYNELRQYNETRGGKTWVNMINDRWKIITSISGEEAAWDIIKQDHIVNNTAANTITGDKNYWFNKMDLVTFPQMSNTSLFGTSAFVGEGTWLLWPSSPRYAPYSITYLRGQKRPTIERVTLPEDMLGFGIRGYWDIEINERERLAVSRQTSAAS